MTFSPDVVKKSVTRDDLFPDGSGYATPVILRLAWIPQLRARGLVPRYALPSYWSEDLDYVLKSTFVQTSLWAEAVGIAASKQAVKSFKIDGPPRVSSREADLMLLFGGQGWVASFFQLVQDYLLTDNGCWVEIIRATRGAGSRIVGLKVLDSLRVRRTGDPERPAIFRAMNGTWHWLAAHQVINLTDMPDPAAGWFGVGHCAAERAYDAIYREWIQGGYITEKTAGSAPSKLSILQGISQKSIEQGLKDGEANKLAKGALFYQGSILMGVQSDTPIDVKEVQLRGLPENFNPTDERRQCYIEYANAIGLDPLDLLEPRGGLGTGQQALVMHEKAAGRGLAAFDKQWAHVANLGILSRKSTFAWSDRDPIDEERRAKTEETRANTRAKRIESGEVTPEEARQLAADQGDLPPEWLEQDTTEDVSIFDEDNPDDVAADRTVDASPAPAAPPATLAAAKEHDPADRLAAAVERLVMLQERRRAR